MGCIYVQYWSEWLDMLSQEETKRKFDSSEAEVKLSRITCQFDNSVVLTPARTYF